MGNSDNDSELVLIVDDHKDSSELVALWVRRGGFMAMTSACGEDAVEIIRQRNIVAVITDLHMSGMSGLELIRNLRAGFPSLPLFLMTSDFDLTPSEARNCGALELFHKPVDRHLLLETLRRTIVSEKRNFNPERK